jgi:hypothetical protein
VFLLKKIVGGILVTVNQGLYGSSPEGWHLASSYGNNIFKSELTVP